MGNYKFQEYLLSIYKNLNNSWPGNEPITIDIRKASKPGTIVNQFTIGWTKPSSGETKN